MSQRKKRKQTIEEIQNQLRTYPDSIIDILKKLPKRTRAMATALYWHYRCMGMELGKTKFNCPNKTIGKKAGITELTVGKYLIVLRKAGLIMRRCKTIQAEHGHFKTIVWITLLKIDDKTIKRDADIQAGIESIKPALLTQIKNQDREIGILQKYIARLIGANPDWHKSFGKDNRKFIKRIAAGQHFNFIEEKAKSKNLRVGSKKVKKTSKKKYNKKVKTKTYKCPYGGKFGEETDLDFISKYCNNQKTKVECELIKECVKAAKIYDDD